MNKREILILSFSAMFFLAVSFVAYSWMEPTSMPNTYSIPINTGSIAQSKAGEIAATIFRDTDDPNYFLNPSGLNKLSKLYVEEGVYSQGGSGDVDGDGRLRLLDMILISRYLSGEFKLGSPEFTIDMWREADVNGDGRVEDSLDATLIALIMSGYTLEEAQLTGKQIADRAIDVDGDGYVRIKYLGGGSGDVNGDGSVDTRDSMLILQYLNGIREFTDEQRYEADINGDGSVDTLDAVMIARLGMGKPLAETRSFFRTIKDRAIDVDGEGNVSFSGNIGDVLAKNVQVEGDVCLANGKCLSDLLNRLVFGVHSYNDCENADGIVEYESGSSDLAFCKFTDSSCPVGWTQYKNWSETEASKARSCTCQGNGCCSGQQIATRGANINGWADCSGHTPVFGGHSWSNTPVETTLLGAKAGGCACYDCCWCSVNATVTAVGCY